MRLKIKLPRTWKQIDNSDGPTTFCRDDGSGAFQVSWAQYRGGKLPKDVSTESLKKMAEEFGKEYSDEMTGSNGGECPYGMFGTATYRSVEYPRSQVWFISDGRDFIMATHICGEEPDEIEVAEAQQIAMGLALGP
jgi:hypothetical protein